MKTDLNIINICLSDTPMQEFIRENRILGRIISAIPEIPFEKVKIGECIRYCMRIKKQEQSIQK